MALAFFWEPVSWLVTTPLGLGSHRACCGSRQVTCHCLLLYSAAFCASTSSAGRGHSLHPDPARGASDQPQGQNQQPGCALGPSHTEGSQAGACVPAPSSSFIPCPLPAPSSSCFSSSIHSPINTAEYIRDCSV